ncbi:hypothetical protein PPTG_16364 [Phytophthora nicotianae INRA-310]|uniref:Amino acid transporter transmembrane domain-containing protein n=1 Tax=Phytophthora nicotianae (strain INRA-310) TaxID=761204 RepID=W2PRT8_PHYN3|nr:hypothetical protein PPTG_16364 [Phytophthora nicotianae INRA-310]ETN03336.1 hypothetical protein PPTG_16364 [Phytophthora nicotianae INRA-310]
MAAMTPSEPRRSAFFTLEDAKISFSIICCICGIGTLAMPSNFARAGPNDGWEELRDKLSTNGPVTSVNEHAARDLESNADSDIDTLSNSAKREQEEKEHDEAQLSDYSGSANVFRYVTLRLVIMAILVGAAIGFRSHFLDLVDFTGASAITVCCLVLPLVFYLKVFWRDLPMYERVVAVVVIVVCTVVGCYVMIDAGKNLFNPDSDGVTFPYCPAEHQSEPYYVRNSTA